MDGSLFMEEIDQVHENARKAQFSTGAQPPPAGRHLLVGRHSFVVRIWQEESTATWRGWVQYTRTGEAMFVQGLEELLSFIECRTGRLSP
jgi:hypothetical protein